MRYADIEGLDRIKTAIEKFAQEIDSDRYQVSKYLERLVMEKKKFYEA